MGLLPRNKVLASGGIFLQFIVCRKFFLKIAILWMFSLSFHISAAEGLLARYKLGALPVLRCYGPDSAAAYFPITFYF